MAPVLRMCLAVTVSDSHRGLQCGASVDVFSSDRVRLTPRTAVWGPVLRMCLAVTVSDSHRGLQCGRQC